MSTDWRVMLTEYHLTFLLQKSIFEKYQDVFP